MKFSDLKHELTITTIYLVVVIVIIIYVVLKEKISGEFNITVFLSILNAFYLALVVPKLLTRPRERITQRREIIKALLESIKADVKNIFDDYRNYYLSRKEITLSSTEYTSLTSQKLFIDYKKKNLRYLSKYISGNELKNYKSALDLLLDKVLIIDSESCISLNNYISVLECYSKFEDLHIKINLIVVGVDPIED